MAYKFTINPECLKRNFAVYVVVAKGKDDIKIYVGKTGDNREGCNPIISRCGNHFSYNKIHSQVRNKMSDHEYREYTYIFEHFDEYKTNNNRETIDKINEMERWLNEKVFEEIKSLKAVELLNKYSGKINRKCKIYRTKSNEIKLNGIIKELRKEIAANKGLSQ